jgi:hypothetical protein
VNIVAHFQGDKYNAPSGSNPTVGVVQPNCEDPKDPASTCSVSVSAPEFGASPMLVGAVGLVLVLGLRAISQIRRPADRSPNRGIPE